MLRLYLQAPKLLLTVVLIEEKHSFLSSESENTTRNAKNRYNTNLKKLCVYTYKKVHKS